MRLGEDRDRYSHTVLLGYSPDVVCGGDCASDRGLLLVVRQPLACKVGTSSLRDLEDNRRLDVSGLDISCDVNR